MEIQVSGDQPLVITTRGRALQRVVSSVEGGARPVSHFLGREPGGQALKGAAQHAELGRILGRQADDRPSAVRSHLDQPFVGQLAKRGADRSTAEDQLLRELLLGNPAARHARAGYDQLAHCVRSAIGKAAPLDDDAAGCAVLTHRSTSAFVFPRQADQWRQASVNGRLSTIPTQRGLPLPDCPCQAGMLRRVGACGTPGSTQSIS